MAVDISTPVDAIEGIGPATRLALGKMSIHHVFDLLRAPATSIHQAVKNTSSLEQVQQWQSMASLLLVKEVTPQWAEALVKDGIVSIAELAVQETETLIALFNQAAQSALIPGSPDDNEVVNMLRDAAVLDYSGTLQGTVAGPTGEPVPGASVKVGYVEDNTDDNGRFILVRLKLGRATPLVISHPDYQTSVIEHPGIASQHKTISVQKYLLSPAGADGAEVNILLERMGDEVPVPNGIPMRELTLGEDDLVDDDILMVRSFYKSSPGVKMLSRFKHYEDGEFVAISYRVPLDRLPDGITRKQMYRYRAGEFSYFSDNPDQLRREVAPRRVRKELADQVIGSSKTARKRAVSERMQAMIDAGLFRGRV